MLLTPGDLEFLASDNAFSRTGRPRIASLAKSLCIRQRAGGRKRSFKDMVADVRRAASELDVQGDTDSNLQGEKAHTPTVPDRGRSSSSMACARSSAETSQDPKDMVVESQVAKKKSKKRENPTRRDAARLRIKGYKKIAADEAGCRVQAVLHGQTSMALFLKPR